MSSFSFKFFSVRQSTSPFKVGTDAILLGAWAKLPTQGTFLDVGSGTGILSLIACQRSQALCVALEPNALFYPDLEWNVTQGRFSDRLLIKKKSLQSFTPSQPFDHILCNPPYFTSGKRSLKEGLAQARHQDSLTLDELFSFALSWLSPKGHLSLVMPYDAAVKTIATALSHHLFCCRCCRVRDQKGSGPSLLLASFSKTPHKPEVSQLVLKKNSSERSEEFSRLTADLYETVP